MASLGLPEVMLCERAKLRTLNDIVCTACIPPIARQTVFEYGPILKPVSMGGFSGEPSVKPPSVMESNDSSNSYIHDIITISFIR